MVNCREKGGERRNIGRNRRSERERRLLCAHHEVFWALEWAASCLACEGELLPGLTQVLSCGSSDGWKAIRRPCERVPSVGSASALSSRCPRLAGRAKGAQSCVRDSAVV